MAKDNKQIEETNHYVNAEPTMEEITSLSKQFEQIGNNNHRLFVKALFMYERDIHDEETLDKMLDIYYNHDISLLNDLIIEKTWF